MNIVYVLSVHPKPKFSGTTYEGCRTAAFTAPPTPKRAIAVFRKVSEKADKDRLKYDGRGPSKMDKRFDAAVEKILATEKIPKIPDGSDCVRTSSYFESGHMSMEIIEVWKA